MPINTLVVDDEEPVRRAVVRMLEPDEHECRTAADAGEARKALAHDTFDLLLCDVNLPGESGIELVKEVLVEHPETAVVMITGVDDPAIARVALEAGAYGYVVKPFTRNELVINVTNALLRRRLERESRENRAVLVDTVRERTEDLWRTIQHLEVSDKSVRSSIEEMMERLALAAEVRDAETARHVERMSRYSALLAGKAGFDEERCSEIRLASRLHDAGKIGIQDRVLRKRGKFTPEDFEIMKQHAHIGYQLFAGSTARPLVLAASIARTHHEWWDGSGYPDGLVGEQIPIEGRIAAVADVFDALLSKRTYKPAFPLGRVVEIMQTERGTHFDPELVDLFLGSIDEALVVASDYPDQ